MAHGDIGGDVEASLQVALSVLSEELSPVSVGAPKCSADFRVEANQGLGKVTLND